MFPSPYFYPQSLVSNLDPGAALYLYRGPSAPPPALQRPLVPRILLHGLQGANEPPPLPPLSGVLSRPTPPRWTPRFGLGAIHGSSELHHQRTILLMTKYSKYITKPQKQAETQKVVRDIFSTLFNYLFSLLLFFFLTYMFSFTLKVKLEKTNTNSEATERNNSGTW